MNVGIKSRNANNKYRSLGGIVIEEWLKEKYIQSNRKLCIHAVRDKY